MGVNQFRHGTQIHLAGNIGILLFAGLRVEREIGFTNTLILVFACAVLGGVVQNALVGPNFVGISGPAYGLATFAVVQHARPEFRVWIGILLFVIAVAEVLTLGDRIAVWTHVISMFVGALAVFGNLFGSSEPTLKPMQMTHLSKVVAIINETDEDDALDAEETLLKRGMDGMFVLMQKQDVLGVTGYAVDEDTDGSAWLSWTYLTEARRGEGLGGQMMNDLLGRLNEMSVRKIFMATSDYAEDGVPIYADAFKLYEEFGADIELKVPDYHSPGETKIVYGLNNPEYPEEAPIQRDPPKGVRFTGAYLAPEAEGTMGIDWQEADDGVSGLAEATASAAKKKGHMAVLALPSDLSDLAQETLSAEGYANCGKLADFYQTGLHQVWWSRHLKQ
nr:rhomboid family intramembrane serine protease [Actibacterium sp. 188UL27-1]